MAAQGSSPGEYIPERRMEEGDLATFYDLSISEAQERGRVEAIDHDSEHQVASIRIFSDNRLETDVPFAWDLFQPERGYAYDGELTEGDPL